MSAAEPSGELQVNLETQLPKALAVGRGSSLFVYGTCFHPRLRVTDLKLTVDGAEIEPLAQQMPRTDLYEMALAGIDGSSGGEADRARAASNAYRSAFWGLVDFEPRERPGRAVVGLAVTLEGGQRCEVELDSIELDPGRRPEATPAARQVAICMATYNPPDELFERQIDSIREQTHNDWVCVISDDHSSPERLAYMQAVIGDDERFILDRSPRRLGFYHNFERALRLAPPSAEFVAFADQDDRWHPEKLEVLLGAIGSANLVYSDMRIVDGEGHKISDTYWSHRRNAYSNLASVMLANTITGAASLFRAELLDYALPFPPRHGDCYHDHWVAMVALTLGDVRYVDRPLYDYVQHGGAALGHALANRDQGRLHGRDLAAAPGLESGQLLLRLARHLLLGLLPDAGDDPDPLRALRQARLTAQAQRAEALPRHAALARRGRLAGTAPAAPTHRRHRDAGPRVAPPARDRLANRDRRCRRATGGRRG